MITFYKTLNGIVTEISELEDKCWINVVHPTVMEIEYLVNTIGVREEFLKSALDREETSHTDEEDNQKLIIVDIADIEKNEDSEIYVTTPMGVILTGNYIITITLNENKALEDIILGRVKGVDISDATQFLFHILLRIAVVFLIYLRRIERKFTRIEKTLYESLKNEELIQLLTLNKALVYFSASLKANEVTLEKILRGRVVDLTREDSDILDDALIEIRQAIEMANIYSSILSGTMDAYASVVSNNLNIIMKVLTLITIIMTVPNIIFSFYGMNVSGIPLTNFWWAPIIISVVGSLIAWFWLKKGKMY